MNIYKNLKLLFNRFGNNVLIIKNLKDKSINIIIKDSGKLILKNNMITGYILKNNIRTDININFNNNNKYDIYNYILMRITNVYRLQLYKKELNKISFEDIFEDNTYQCLLSEYSKQCFIPLNDFYYNIIFTIGNNKDVAECLDVREKNIKIIKRDSRRAIIKKILGEIND